MFSLSWFYIIPILGFLIFIHEVGHYVAARMCGVKVEEFGMGIPPKLFGWVRNGVVYSVNAIPFGGFVRVKGEDGENVESDSMNAKSPAQRAFFLSAGIIMNILFAVFLMILVVGIKGRAAQRGLYRWSGRGFARRDCRLAGRRSHRLGQWRRRFRPSRNW